MISRCILLSGLAVLLADAGSFAQNFAPPEPVTPTEEQKIEIRTRFNRLSAILTNLRKQGVRDPFLADAEIYAKAGEWIRRHGEYYDSKYIDWTIEELNRGLLRASQLAMGESPWLNFTGRSAIRAYRSRVDGSLQPYAVTLPADYGKNRDKRYRLDVVLHGRNSKLTEVSFLHQFTGEREAPKGQSFIQIDVYGRGNNAYRWAGETDVLDVIDHFIAVERMLNRNPIDGNRVILRGFSMGGAGTWHIGLHRPERWCVIGPGAGFTTTHGYASKVPAKLPDYQESCLKIYDAVEYAENVAHVPVVAYSGEKDKQKQAADNIEQRLKGTNWRIKHLIAPGLEHAFPDEWKAKAEQEYAGHVKDGRPDDVKRVHFVTFTLRYNRCEWVEILGLDKHYERSVVDAERTEAGYKVTTKNIRVLHLALPVGEGRLKLDVQIDGQSLEATPYRTQGIDESHLYFEKRAGSWKVVFPQKLAAGRLRQLQKTPGMQGPIDDAFTESFLLVRGTGKPWNEDVHNHAEAALKRFEETWDKYMRGTLTVKKDTEVTSEDLQNRHLVLFGDPGSNSILAQILDSLPLKWTEKTVSIGSLSGDASKHMPVLIYPSPLNVGRYVVVNTGHTFGAEDFKDTNAMLYPRLGDYGLLKLAPTEKDSLATEVVGAGLFDDQEAVRCPR